MKKARIDVVPGEEIHTSATSRIFGVVLAIAVLLLGLACLFAQCYLLFAPKVGLYITYLVYGGYVLTILGAIGLPYSIYIIFRPERLIIGDDCFQRVVGKSKVVENIPFISISELVMKDITTNIGIRITNKGIGIMLRSLTEDSVRIKSKNVKEMTGYDSTIEDTYLLPLDLIYERMVARWNACRKPG